MLNLHQLKVFVVSAEEGSFSSAARKLGKAQSVISHTISNLEVDLNLELFDRKTRSPTLTPEGVKLLSHARAVLHQTQELKSAARSMGLNNESSITITTDPSLLLPNLYKMMDEFSCQFPDINVTLNISQSVYIPDLVKSGKTHFGLMLIDSSMPSGVELGLLGHLPFYVVAHKKHPLSNLKSVSRSSLALYRQLVFLNTEGEPASQLPVISPKLYCSNDFSVIKNMVERNLGWGYIPTHMVESLKVNDNLVKLPVSFDIRTWTVPVDRVMQMDGVKGPAFKWLEEKSTFLFGK